MQAALAAVLPGRTALVIAHRLSTVVGADLIHVVEAAGWSRPAPTTRCSAAAGRYAALWRLQHGRARGQRRVSVSALAVQAPARARGAAHPAARLRGAVHASRERGALPRRSPLPHGRERWARGAYHVHTRRSRRARDGCRRWRPRRSARASPSWCSRITTTLRPARPRTWTGCCSSRAWSSPPPWATSWRWRCPAARRVGAAGRPSARCARPAAWASSRTRCSARTPGGTGPARRRATGLELYSADSMFREALARPFSRLLPARRRLPRAAGARAAAARACGPGGRARACSSSPRSVPRWPCAPSMPTGCPPYEDRVPHAGALRAAAAGRPGRATRRRRPRRWRGRWARVRPSACSAAWASRQGFALEGLLPPSAEGRRARVGDVLRVHLPALRMRGCACGSGARAGCARTVAAWSSPGRGRCRWRSGCSPRGGCRRGVAAVDRPQPGAGAAPRRGHLIEQRGTPSSVMRLLYVLASYLLFALLFPVLCAAPQDAQRPAGSAWASTPRGRCPPAAGPASGCTAPAPAICSRSRR